LLALKQQHGKLQLSVKPGPDGKPVASIHAAGKEIVAGGMPVKQQPGSGAGAAASPQQLTDQLNRDLDSGTKGASKASALAGGGEDASSESSFKDQQNVAARKGAAAGGVDTSGKPYGEGGFGKAGFGSQHQTGKFDSELDTASGKGRQRGFGRSNFGGRHQEGELDSASGKRTGGGGSRGAGGKFDEELDTASGKRRGADKASGGRDGGSEAGMPVQAKDRKASFNLDKTQFSRRDRAMDKAAQTALHQASENAHSDIGVA
jgi:hypothetical protein